VNARLDSHKAASVCSRAKVEVKAVTSFLPGGVTMGKVRFLGYLVLLLGFSFAPRLAYAHHGYAAYDMTKTITVKGTVVELSMANPHSSLTFDTKDDSGALNHWAIEFGTLRGLLSEGWTKETLKTGDEITVSLHPAKNGAKVGVLVGKITFADGRPLPVKSGPNSNQ
jgi:Family of unknown function (DUF6152)